MKATRYYDKKNNRLIFINESATPDFWDNHWTKYPTPSLYKKKISPFDYVIKTSNKYLEKGATILEGGCGTGHNVYKLHEAGFNVIGLDYAEKVINYLQTNYPALKFTYGDVRKIPFEDEFFDGYWSFGVIEHFYHGYDQIIKEMNRVIKTGKYLFLTFPHMSKLRRLKVKQKKFPLWKEDKSQIERFYQFALDEEQVMNDLTKLGFKPIDKKYLDGVKGLKDEFPFLHPLLQKIYDSKTAVSKSICKIISVVCSGITSHSILLIFQKDFTYWS